MFLPHTASNDKSNPKNLHSILYHSQNSKFQLLSPFTIKTHIHQLININYFFSILSPSNYIQTQSMMDSHKQLLSLSCLSLALLLLSGIHASLYISTHNILNKCMPSNSTKHKKMNIIMYNESFIWSYNWIVVHHLINHFPCLFNQNHIIGLQAEARLQHYHMEKLFVFGDSYVDTGNTRIDQPGSWKNPYGITFPGKPAGRFSDGRVLTDYIGTSLSFSLLMLWINWNTEKCMLFPFIFINFSSL